VGEWESSMEEAVNPSPSFWRGRAVLITGHSGFKGCWLAACLAKLGAKVSGFSLRPTTEPNLFKLTIQDHIDSHFGDIRNLAALRACMTAVKPQIVFHLAAQSLVRASYSDPVGTYATNVMGTVHLLETVREAESVEAVVVVTSDKCYENREWVWPYREDEAMGGRDPYSNSKGCSELVTAAYRASFFSETRSRKCRIATARAGNVIGGGDWAPDRLIPDVIRSFAKGGPVLIRSPHAVRPWQHVLEPLGGYIRLAEALAAEGGVHFAEGWNFGPSDEDCWPVSSVVDRLAAHWGNGASWRVSKGAHPNEASFLKVDASKAKARLSWGGRLRLEEALVWTADWYRGQLDGHSAVEMMATQIERYEKLGSLPYDRCELPRLRHEVA
jgi:CDP-glucose 4,6-dehydratase